MELIKLKKPIKHKGYVLSEKGLENKRKSARVQMILNNPMKNQESRNKISIKLKGRITNPNYLFKKGNQYGKQRKNTKISEVQKMNQSIWAKKTELHKKAKKFEKGHIPWNKGLTKEIDERVRKNAEATSKRRKELFKKNE